MFTLAICCLMTSVLPWSMDLTFWFLCNFVYYIIGLYTFTTRHIHKCVLFLLFLSLFIPSGPTSLLFSSSILGTYQLGEFIFQCHIFLPFHIVHGILKQACRSGLPLSSSVDHVLSELSTTTLPFWVALRGMVLSFFELGGAMIHVISLVVSCDCGFHSVCPLMDGDEVCGAASWEWLALGKMDLALVGKPCSVNLYSNFLLMGGAVFPPCKFAWGLTMVGAMVVMGVMVTSFKRIYTSMLWLPRLLQPVPLTPWQATVNPRLHQRFLDAHRQVWVSLLWWSLLLSPGSWCTQGFVVSSKGLLPQSCGSCVIKSHWPSKSNSLRVLRSFADFTVWEICRGPWNFCNFCRLILLFNITIRLIGELLVIWLAGFYCVLFIMIPPHLYALHLSYS